MTESNNDQLNTSFSYSPEMMSETEKYLIDLKHNNKKAYNKYKKQGKKFSDTIMARLK